VFTLVATRHFLHTTRKFLIHHPDLRVRFAEIIEDLRKDPFAPHLAYHHLRGKLKDIKAVSITNRYRITLTIAIIENEIILLDIGSHDEIYR
jgi:mRNA-degrading endonuclease YafQ of YafQ-DinJ toxin-antitoxin module